MKPIITNHDHEYYFTKRVRCGKCEKVVGSWDYGRAWLNGEKERFLAQYDECPHCGEPIDWSDEK